MTHSITVKVTDWNGEKEMGLDAYVKTFTDQAAGLIYVLDVDSDNLGEDHQYLNEIKEWTKKKAVQKFMALYAAQNA